MKIVGFLLALALVVSGCVSGGVREEPLAPETTAEPSPTSTAEAKYEDNESLQAAGRGSMEGFVHDEYAYIIEGAHVALAGTNHFKKTNKDGNFRFDNLSAKAYKVRIDREEFVSYEADVDVRAGKVTTLDVTLLRRVDPNAQMSVPHKHDYWGGEREVVIMDRDLRNAPACVAVAREVHPGEPMCEWRILFGSVDDPNERPNVVLQGTGKMTVQIKVANVLYPADVWVKRAGKAPVKATTISSTSTTWETSITETETDPSHFRKSLWEFLIRMNTNGGSDVAMAYLAPMHWLVTLTRSDREIPVEPPHPDLWGNETERVLHERPNCRHQITPVSTSSRDVDCPIHHLRQGQTVPVGTSRMKATLSWANTYLVPTKFALEYVGADRTASGTYSEWMRPAATKEGTNMREFEFNVRPEFWDSPYAENSQWRFRYSIVNEPPGSFGVFDGTVNLKVEIFRDAS